MLLINYKGGFVGIFKVSKGVIMEDNLTCHRRKGTNVNNTNIKGITTNQVTSNNSCCCNPAVNEADSKT